MNVERIIHESTGAALAGELATLVDAIRKLGVVMPYIGTSKSLC